MSLVGLSFEKTEDGIPIAVARNGKKGRLLYLTDNSLKKDKKICFSGSKSVDLDTNEMFELIPTADREKRDVFYVAGQSGSGKSYIAKQLAQNYKRLFPDREIYLISKLEKDETLDALDYIKRLNIQSFIDSYPSIEEFERAMIIFDDYDTLTGEADKVVHKLIDDLAIQGRHTVTTMLCLSHHLSNYKKTKLILSEATHIVVYPLSTAYKPLKYVLGTYVGVEPDDVDRLRKMGSRWLCFKKGFPSYCITMRHAEVLFV